jgi:hypothetical protein
VAIDPKTGTFTGPGLSPAFTPVFDRRAMESGSQFNISAWGTFTGTIRPVRSFDNGATWLPVTYVDGSAISWAGPFSISFQEVEEGVLEALTGFTGTANYRLSQ